MATQRTGSILVNGHQRQIRVTRNIFGKTVIKVDGMTVYEKTPMIPQKSVEFGMIPGKKASLKWRQTPDLKMECSILVDGCTTKLAALPETAAEKRAQEKTQQWLLGAGSLALAAFGFWMNYNSLRTDGTYYPKAIGMIPSLVCIGMMCFLHPHVNCSPKSRTGQVVAAVTGLAIAGFGFTFFTHWFLATFSQP